MMELYHNDMSVCAQKVNRRLRMSKDLGDKAPVCRVGTGRRDAAAKGRGA